MAVLGLCCCRGFSLVSVSRGYSLVMVSELFLFFGGTCDAVCGILVLHQGSNRCPPALEAWSLNHWAAREVPRWLLLLQSMGSGACEFH